MAKLFDADSTYLFYGIILVVLSIVFLLSSLGAFRSGYHIMGEQADLLISFFFIVVGCAMVFSAAGKPGKPAFNVNLREIKTGP
ncbi:MAG: hypothetical protein JW744_03895 [Candidatus Diapherotrites archaeon]|uniref:Uncharacterized protein n=1 Tax=Candidatus Iainarchaeum sp. TaxID=3101447 RepID=A0A938YWT6_9ARCH|nr:hypothetical protein [Candidatus Diapherotrites archaeon]